MIRINLLPVREARRAANLRQQGVLLGAALSVALVVCAGLHFSIVASISSERDKIQVARVELAKLEETRREVERFRRLMFVVLAAAALAVVVSAAGLAIVRAQANHDLAQIEARIAELEERAAKIRR